MHSSVDLDRGTRDQSSHPRKSVSLHSAGAGFSSPRVHCRGPSVGDGRNLRSHLRLILVTGREGKGCHFFRCLRGPPVGGPPPAV